MPRLALAVKPRKLKRRTLPVEFYQRLERAPYIRVVFEGRGALKMSRRAVLAVCQKEGFASLTDLIQTALADGQWQISDNWRDPAVAPTFIDHATPDIEGLPAPLFAFINLHETFDPSLSFWPGEYAQ